MKLKKKLCGLAIGLLLSAGIAVVLSALLLHHYSPHQEQAVAVLDDTGVPYELKRSSGGWIRRQMHCEIVVARSDIPALSKKLGLDEPLPWFENTKRLIVVADSEDPCSSSLREKYAESFAAGGNWKPSRHGFSGAIFFYNEKTERGCLLLSIAYG